MARRRVAPRSKQSSRLRPPDVQASRSCPPLVCEPHDSFALRAVTAASAIAWPRLSDSSSASARSDARRRRCFARRPGVPMAGIPLLDLGEFSSATSGSLTVALRAAASESRGHGVCCCRPARASAGTDGLVRHRRSSWRSDAVAQRPVAPLGLPVRVDFWSAGRMQRWRPRDGTAAGSPGSGLVIARLTAGFSDPAVPLGVVDRSRVRNERL
jgi:hypothetical protein